MNICHRLRFASALVLGSLALSASTLSAHEFKLDAVMNAFVKVEPNEAHLVVRAPLYLFKAVKFPIKGTEVDVDAAAPAMQRALAALQQDITVFEDGRPLIARQASGRLTLPSDRSFENYEQALRHVSSALEPGVGIVVDQGYVDAHFTYSIASPNSVFSVRTTAAPELGDYLKLALRYIPVDSDGRAMVVTSRSGTVPLNPTWLKAAAGFIGAGIAHILTGFDHLLFLLCLVIPLRNVRQIVTVITGFTLAHSFTLIGSAFNLAPEGAWFPPFVETVIALSIIYMALEDIVGVNFQRRLLLTMLFGLAHGFGFSYGLKEQLQFAGSHLLVSLFAFNVGVEIGQILVLLVMLPALVLIRRYVLPGRVGTVILAALAAHAAWHWTVERWEAMTQVRWPTLDAANVTTLLFWIAGLALAGGVISAVVARMRLEQQGSPASDDRAIASARVGD
jgi:hypothetical protein